MNGRKLNVYESIESLKRKGCKFDMKNQWITIEKSLGNKSWGLVDFLCNYGSWRIKK